MLHRSPGFALIAIATMALGVGATTGVTAVLTAVAPSYIPALRAMRLDPITTPHSE
jgi:TRAP-type C4-dicarboxylate transport system permease large subunit